jgi:hypothetical protein
MGAWNPVNRPVTAAEIAMSFDATLSTIEGILRRHRVSPAVRIGRLRLYGPHEVRTIYAALQSCR